MNLPFQRLEADLAISITNLKKNPNAVFQAAELQPIAVLNHNKVVAYIVSPEAWEGAIEAADDLSILKELEDLKDEETIPVSLDDLRGKI
jgi:antitoxin StbD